MPVPLDHAGGAPRPLFAIVETWMSSFGLRVLTAACELGLAPVFMTSDRTRYTAIAESARVLEDPDLTILDIDTNSAGDVAAAMTALGAGARLAGIFTVVDYNVPVVAEVAAALGLLGLSPTAAAQARNKLATRDACAANGIAGPRYAHVASAEEAIAASRSIGLPCVIKPMTESNSFDVRLCRTDDDVRRHFASIADNRVDVRGQARPSGALVEEYLVGHEVSVEVVATGGGHTALGVVDKLCGPHPYFAEVGDVFPSALPADVVASCEDAAVRALQTIGHDFGAAHVELKVTRDGPKLIEINARAGGHEVTDLIRLGLGIDILRELVKLHSGLDASFAPTMSQAVSTRFFMATAGEVTDIHGVDLACRVEGVVDVKVNVGPGSSVPPLTSNAGLLGYVMATGRSPGEAARRADTAAGQVAIDVAPSAAAPRVVDGSA